MESAQHVLEKWVWSEGDFARMNWRDSGIHATAIVREEIQPRLGLSLLFDIDYIVQPADLSRTQRTHWVAPATLAFENVSDVEFYLRPDIGLLRIAEIVRFEETNAADKGTSVPLWILEGMSNTGSVRFHAIGYKQYFRQTPLLKQWPDTWLDASERGGISFLRKDPSGTAPSG
jgi:hypothetical protein